MSKHLHMKALACRIIAHELRDHLTGLFIEFLVVNTSRLNYNLKAHITINIYI